jgi:hypothetical protein
MASTYSSNLKIQLMTTGENTGTWGNVTNVNLGTAIEEAIVGSASVSFNGADITLTLTNSNATQTARNIRLVLTGISGGARQLVVPALEKTFIVKNELSDTCTVLVSGQTGVAVPAGRTMWLYNDGTDVKDVTTYLSNLALGTPLPVSSGGTGSNTGVNVQTIVSGILPVANGGTGSATAAFNGSGITNLNATAISSGVIANTYTTANTANQSDAIVVRDTGGNFAANTITANLIGSVTGASSLNVLTSAFTGANQSLTSPGWQKLPGGLMLQWGYVTATTQAVAQTVNFPTSFPTACLLVLTQIDFRSGSSFAGGYLSVTSFNTASFNCFYTMSRYYIAIGY